MSATKDIKTKGRINTKNFKTSVIIKIILAFDFLCIMFFLPAGTFLYWQAWIYMALLFIPMTFLLIYLIKHDPKLLESRMRMKEKVIEQKRIIKISWVFFLFAYLIPGFDIRYGWSHVPLWVIIVAEILVLAGYLMFAVVLRHNSYASRIIEVQKKQKVISTGPYAIVRHPMYSAILIMYIASPLALGSYWALLPTLAIPIVIIARILNEEKVLKKELKGYTEYTHKVRYRLIPSIW